MPLRKIKENINPYCNSPDHSVPMHMVLDNGVYEHICSACGKKTIFEVSKPTFATKVEGTYWRAVKCKACNGTGTYEDGSYSNWMDTLAYKCGACNGTGVVPETS